MAGSNIQICLTAMNFMQMQLYFHQQRKNANNLALSIRQKLNIDLSKVAFVTSPTADKEALSAVTSDSSSTWELTLTASDSTMEATATANGNS